MLVIPSCYYGNDSFVYFKMSSSAQMPILLENGHHITRLIVQNAHQRVMHNGVRETLLSEPSTGCTW